MSVLDASIIPVLATIPVPNMSLTVADIARQEGNTLVIDVGYPIAQVKASVESEIRSALEQQNIVCDLRVEQRIPSVTPGNIKQLIPGVKNIIAVASGKGGVGKSTTAANIALALAYEGATVGVLDADIYGPSQPQMLGVPNLRPEVLPQNKIVPLNALGLQLVSMGSLVTEKTPMIWRGPMVSGALQQLLTQTQWDNVDYLIVDMPPGTGDIQLTLSQSVPVSSSVIVTTPQDIALLDAKKGIEMFRKVNIPVVGIVENMATHVCSQCGHEEAIFGEHGGAKLAEEFASQVLGRLPLKLAIREQAESGKPTVAADPLCAESLQYRQIATVIAADIWQRAMTGPSGPTIEIADD
ncbi:Iron-sulfur cluster carrier protein [Thalassocella blandensis]|nr:Iron-sulfur cluster carrier protein [Thalassocella blandensis]